MSNLLDFDPKTIAYSPEHDGQPATTRTLQQLLLGAEALGFVLEQIPGGYMGALEKTEDGFPRRVVVWDEAGRVSRVDFIGTVGVHDRTGDLAGEQSPLFSNEYTYDVSGVLVHADQVVTQNDLTTYVYRNLHETAS